MIKNFKPYLQAIKWINVLRILLKETNPNKWFHFHIKKFTKYFVHRHELHSETIKNEEEAKKGTKIGKGLQNEHVWCCQNCQLGYIGRLEDNQVGFNYGLTHWDSCLILCIFQLCIIFHNLHILSRTG